MSHLVASQEDASAPASSTSSELTVKHSNIKKDERFDVRWEGMPFKFRRIGRGPKATFEKVCIMPLWLRNLWPASEFDPCAVWEQAKEEEAEEALKAKSRKAAGSGKSGGSKSAGGKKSSSAKVGKKEAIQAEQAKKRAEETVERDLEKLGNVLKMRERSMLYGMKMETKLGRLNQMLEGRDGGDHGADLTRRRPLGRGRSR